MENGLDGKDCSPNDEEESDIWTEKEEEVLQEIASDEPLPEPTHHQSSMQSITILLQWLVYFLLLWHSSRKISDNGLEWLLRFMLQFFHTIGVTCKCEYLCQMAVMFPSSLYLLQKFVKLKRDNFVKFAVCPRCSSLYDLENCTRQVGGRTVSSICTLRPFKRGQKGECGEPFARKVILNSGKVCFYPFKVYCFNSVIEQLERLLKRPGVPEMCEQWHEHQVEENTVADVYDGSIWSDFLTYKGDDFLNAPRSLACVADALNVLYIASAN